MSLRSVGPGSLVRKGFFVVVVCLVVLCLFIRDRGENTGAWGPQPFFSLFLLHPSAGSSLFSLLHCSPAEVWAEFLAKPTSTQRLIPQPLWMAAEPGEDDTFQPSLCWLCEPRLAQTPAPGSQPPHPH